MLISKEDISEKLGFKPRTLDYYVRIGMLCKPVRKIRDKRVFWDEDEITETLTRIQIHYNNGGKLKDLAQLQKERDESTTN